MEEKRMKKALLLLLVACFAFGCIGSVFGAVYASETELAPGCKAVYLCDENAKMQVYARNEKKHLPIASVCKVMTLLLCFEAVDEGRLSLDEDISVSKNAAGMGGSQVFLESGGVYKATDLIQSIAIASANDSCVAMAERIAGSEEGFVKKMNARAKELGMEDTVFVNCTGLPKEGQYSCAKDVATMLSALLCHAKYYDYSKIWLTEIKHSGDRVTEMANTNKLIRSYQGCDAGKTGFTNEAGFCLAASASRGDMRVIGVVLGASDSKTRFSGVSALFDHAFANYTSKLVVEKAVLSDAVCPVSGGKIREVSLIPERECRIFCARDDNGEIYVEKVYKGAKAPVARGDVLGEVIVYKDSVEVDRISLLANDDVAKSGYLDSLRELARNWSVCG